MTITAKRPSAIILLAEDDLGDQVLTQEAFRTLRVPHELRIVPDGKEALDYLYRRGSYTSLSAAPRPDLILLDLNMPRVNGQQVAEQIHADPNLRDIPVVVLTTSRREEDLVRAYGRGVASFISKPLDFNVFLSTVQELENLIKFVLADKSLRGHSRLTDRQLSRLMRRRMQLEHLVDRLFQRQIEHIENALAERHKGLEETESAEAGPFSRELVMRLAHKIVQTVPPHGAGAPKQSGPRADSRARAPLHSEDLLRLARALQSPQPASTAAASPENEPAGKHLVEKRRPDGR